MNNEKEMINKNTNHYPLNANRYTLPAIRYALNANKKVCVLTNGCPENRIDGALLEDFFKANDYEITRNFKEADLIFFNACGLDKRFEDLSIKMINKLKEYKRESSQLIVYGCLSKINKERLREVYQGQVFGSDRSDLEKFTKNLNGKKNIKDIYANRILPFTYDVCNGRPRLPDLRKLLSLMSIKEKLARGRLNAVDKKNNLLSPNAYYIKICTGCAGNCSYCAIKFSRGSTKSKPVDKIIAEFKEGLDKGYKEFALLGTDLGPYGVDLGTDLVALLKELISFEDDYKIKLRNIHPKFFIKMWPELKEIFKTGKITFFGCSVQSGSNRILKLMNREYQIEQVTAILKEIKSEFPKILIRTQLMVGFPTETEDDFQKTLSLSDKQIFDFAEIYKFEKRPNTKAAKMLGQIPEKTARKRYHKLFMKSFSSHGRKGTMARII